MASPPPNGPTLETPPSHVILREPPRPTRCYAKAWRRPKDLSHQRALGCGARATNRGAAPLPRITDDVAAAAMDPSAAARLRRVRTWRRSGGAQDDVPWVSRLRYE